MRPHGSRSGRSRPITASRSATFDYQEDDGVGGELFSDSVSSYRLMVGYQFMEHLTVEGGYGKTGTIRDTATFLGRPGGGTFQLDFSAEFSILTIRLARRAAVR